MNYLNPSIFINGLDFYKSYYFGWILFGTYTDVSKNIKVYPNIEEGGYLPANDICVGGFSLPIPGSEAFTLESEDANAVSKTSSGKNENSNLSIKQVENGTSLKFLKKTSDATFIYPAGFNSTTNTEVFIDINEDTSGLLLVAYKPASNVVAKLKAATDKTTTFKNVLDTTFESIKYVHEDARDIQIMKEGANATAFINHANCVPILCYSITNDVSVNDFNYTGFAVGDVSVSLDGLTS